MEIFCVQCTKIMGEVISGICRFKILRQLCRTSHVERLSWGEVGVTETKDNNTQLPRRASQEWPCSATGSWGAAVR